MNDTVLDEAATPTTSLPDGAARESPAGALFDAVRYPQEAEEAYVRSGLWADDTLSRWLAKAVADHGERPALVAAEGSISYRVLADRSARVARGLLQLGIGRGDVVAVQLPSTAEFLVLYLAIARIGAVTTTVHMPYRAEEIRQLLAHGGAKLFVGMSRFKDHSPVAEVLSLRDRLPHLGVVVAVGEDAPGTVNYRGLEAAEPVPPDHPEPAPADPFLLLFTSGTSASPKAVPLAYRVTLGNSRMVARELGFGPDDLILSAAPFTHLFGLYGIHLALLCGGAMLLMPSFTPAELAAKIAHFRPTVLLSAPAHMANLDHAGLLDAADLSSLRLVISSGAPCPPDLVRLMVSRMRGHFVLQWGMTELQAGTFTRPGDHIGAATSVGRACPGVEFRVADAERRPCPPDVEGELQVRGSPVFRGYFRNEEANRVSFTADGWFRTGDLAMVDSSGNLHITGRTKNIINRGGVKYNPTEIEALLIRHPDVIEVAVVAYPDPILGERACCFVVPKDDGAPSLEELCAFLMAQGVSKPKLPERLEVIDEMPMTPTRKVIRGKLQERLKQT